MCPRFFGFQLWVHKYLMILSVNSSLDPIPQFGYWIQFMILGSWELDVREKKSDIQIRYGHSFLKNFDHPNILSEKIDPQPTLFLDVFLSVFDPVSQSFIFYPRNRIRIPASCLTLICGSYLLFANTGGK